MAFDNTDAPIEILHKERMTKLRDVINLLPRHQFDMSNPMPSECGSPACICGWARTIFFKKEWKNREEIAEFLGIPSQEAANLFWMDMYEDDLFYRVGPHPDWSYVTPKRAVKVLDHYIATGKVDWSII